MNITDRHQQSLEMILDSGLIAVIRLQDPSPIPSILKALCRGGVRAVEITMTTPHALEVLRETSRQFKECLIGAGTVLDPYTARTAILAGARFVVSPVFHADVVRLCKSYSTVVIPGTFTPTEILRAWEAGADIIKVFPAPRLGVGYFKDVLAPLPQVRLLPTGVELSSVEAYIDAGVSCISSGAQLISPQAVANQDWNSITQTAEAFLKRIQAARNIA